MKRNVISYSFRFALVEISPLRKVDPRIKLLLALATSLAVMLSLERLVIFWVGYLIFLMATRLLPEFFRMLWRIKWLLVVLFILDYFLIDLDLAVAVTLRLSLMSGVFILLVATTTPGEIGMALESLGLPFRYAFSLGLAFQSLSLLDEEWRAIQEAQRSRGMQIKFTGLRKLTQNVGDLVAFTVPAVVLTTKRAWSITEAAYARGFDSPNRSVYHRLRFKPVDWFYGGIALLVVGLIFWR